MMDKRTNKTEKFEKGDVLVVINGVGHWNEGEHVIYLGKKTDSIAHIKKENWSFEGWLDYDRLEKYSDKK